MSDKRECRPGQCSDVCARGRRYLVAQKVAFARLNRIAKAFEERKCSKQAEVLSCHYKAYVLQTKAAAIMPADRCSRAHYKAEVEAFTIVLGDVKAQRCRCEACKTECGPKGRRMD